MKKKYSFTLIEMLVTMGLITILVTIVTRNLFTARHQASISTTILSLVNDIKEQQNKAMIGDNYSVYFEPTRYTLFRGQDYLPSAPDNFVVDLETSLKLTNINLPQSKIVFASGSGEIVNFVSGQNTLTIENSQTGQAHIINLNRLGVITSIL